MFTLSITSLKRATYLVDCYVSINKPLMNELWDVVMALRNGCVVLRNATMNHADYKDIYTRYSPGNRFLYSTWVDNLLYGIYIIHNNNTVLKLYYLIYQNSTSLPYIKLE